MANKRGWGGARPGAGRRPGPDPKVSHRAREEHDGRRPLLVTFRRAKDAPSLRGASVTRAIHEAIRGASTAAATSMAAATTNAAFRIVRFAISPTEVQLIAHATDQRSLAWGARSVAIRVARAINGVLGRKGPVWSERYRTRALTTAREVRDATNDPKKQWVAVRA